MRFSVDTGGTFTDVIVAHGDKGLRVYKTPTIANDPVQGVLNGLALAAEDFQLGLREFLASGEVLIHGTTTATNAIITGNTAKTAFLTTAGHPDVLLLREGGRMGAPMFDYSVPYPKPYVPRALTFEVVERVSAEGDVIVPLDEAALEGVADELRKREVQSVGVCLLWSIVNNVHETRVGEILAQRLPDLRITLSHVLNPTIREYRRASAACLDASLKPVMERYLTELSRRVSAEGFCGQVLVVTAQGTVRDPLALARAPIHTVNSGPAMAPVAGKHVALLNASASTAIVADTGGTTFDVSLIRDGRIPETRETWLGTPYLGHMTGFPSIDVRSVGAGGGSIASVDEAGLLSVGPHSAGAEPGPACYAAGGVRATLTDACLVLGFIDSDTFLGGQKRLCLDAAHRAIEDQVANPMALDLIAGAQAIVAVATETMALAIEDITINQGIDPRSAVLIGGGGAAGFNAVAIARRIGCPTVIIPSTASALSAAGALLSDLGEEFAELFVTTRRAFDRHGVNNVLHRLSAACEKFEHKLGVAPGQARIEFSTEARYAHQVWEIKVPLRAGQFPAPSDCEQLFTDFHALHRDIFAVDDGQADIEFISWRARVACPQDDAMDLPQARSTTALASKPRWVHFAETGRVKTPTVRAEEIADQAVVNGPAIVESTFTTIVIDPGSTCRRSRSGDLIIDVVAPGASS